MLRFLIVRSKNDATEFVNGVSSHGTFTKNDVTSHEYLIREKEFISTLRQNASPILLPTGVVWCNADRKSLIIESPPGIQLMKFKNGAQEDQMSSKTFKIKTPWVYYGITSGPNSVPYVSHVYFRHSPIEPSNTALYGFPIPNLFKTGGVCTHVLGSDDDGLSYSVLVNRAIDDFWSAGFNNDVQEYMSTISYKQLVINAAQNNMSPYEYWEHCTRYDIGWEKLFPELSNARYDFDWVTRELNKANPMQTFGNSLGSRFMNQVLLASMEATQT